MSRIAFLFFAVVVCVVLATTFLEMSRPSGEYLSDNTTCLSSEISQLDNHSLPTDLPGQIYPVVVRKPAGPPRIELDGTDPQGRSGSVACSTCHSVREPNFENVSAETLDEFHRGMTFRHGKIACYACHNPDSSDELRLADGTSVAFTDVMALCSQCHSPQATAFAHGAHGGMNGYWDLRRGPQMKNNCVDCHDPHAPTYPKMIVGFKPKDRFSDLLHNDQTRLGADEHGQN